MLSPKEAEAGPWGKYLGENRVPACSWLSGFFCVTEGCCRAGQGEGAGSKEGAKGRGILQSETRRVLGCLFLPPKSPGPEWWPVLSWSSERLLSPLWPLQSEERAGWGWVSKTSVCPGESASCHPTGVFFPPLGSLPCSPRSWAALFLYLTACRLGSAREAVWGSRERCARSAPTEPSA